MARNDAILFRILRKLAKGLCSEASSQVALRGTRMGYDRDDADKSIGLWPGSKQIALPDQGCYQRREGQIGCCSQRREEKVVK